MPPLIVTDPAQIVLPAGWRLGRDSRDPADIPVDGTQVVMGYPEWWSDADFARFPDAGHVRISNQPGYYNEAGLFIVDYTVPDGQGDWRHCAEFDIERGALGVQHLRRTVINRNDYRRDSATVYNDISNRRAVLSALRGLRYNMHLAWWLGRPPTPEQVAAEQAYLAQFGVTLVAWQYENLPLNDLSAVVDRRWHPTPGSSR